MEKLTYTVRDIEFMTFEGAALAAVELAIRSEEAECIEVASNGKHVKYINVRADVDSEG